MATIIKPPQNLGNIPKQRSFFLAGSIEMGKAIDWQSQVGNKFNDFDIIIWNPRRLYWDSSWKQSIDNPFFKENSISNYFNGIGIICFFWKMFGSLS